MQGLMSHLCAPPHVICDQISPRQRIQTNPGKQTRVINP